MNWTDLPPETRDFLVRLTVDLATRAGRAAADFIVDEFEKTFQSPIHRLANDLRRLAGQIENMMKAPKWYQAFSRPRAERRDLLRLKNLLDLILTRMKKQNAFFFMYLPGAPDDILILFQTSRSYATRETITTPGAFVASDATHLREVKPWRIEGPSPLPYRDIEGVTNDKLPIRWLSVSAVNAYVPFLNQTDPRACSVALNLLWRLNNAVDPWPQNAPTIYKIGLSTITTYSSYMPGEILTPNLNAVLEHYPHRFEDTLNAISVGLLMASWIHHPDFNPRVMLA